jgi:hypothetical protein
MLVNSANAYDGFIDAVPFLALESQSLIGLVAFSKFEFIEGAPTPDDGVDGLVVLFLAEIQRLFVFVVDTRHEWLPFRLLFCGVNG